MEPAGHAVGTSFVRIELNKTLRVPPASAFEYFADPRNRPNWQRSLRRVELITAGPPALGTRWREWPLGLGEVELEIVRFERDRVWAEEAQTRLGRLTLVLVFEPAPTGTRLGVEATLTLPPWASWADRAVAPLVRREIEGDLQRAARALADA